MRRFSCQSCGQLLSFENTVCEQCGSILGFLPECVDMSALVAIGDGSWRPLAPLAQDRPRRFCANNAYDVCNWLIPDHSPAGGFCFACQFNRVIPNLDIPGNLERWRKLEVAKHRLCYTILRLNLPVRTRREDPLHGLAFDFLDDPADGSPPVMTGHSEGIITIATREADDAYRESMRVELGEYYRTLLGHFRHEIGHYYWNVLIRDGGRLEACRAVFGDERQDYQSALTSHYGRASSENWRDGFVSLYATSHPWEDFAETWAHYFHIVSTLETALAYDLSVGPALHGEALAAQHGDPCTQMSFDDIINAWVPLTYVVNGLNRSMGLSDFYPFVLTVGVRAKLAFIHDVIRDAQKKGY
ncbi:MAG: putative zinc-binding metallopeptidase [Acetobacter sp.]|uniref:zinc-binding metallopeptidase family protein n=1 Tax=Acetobacter sp. TaxID=440 RepID=UPI0039ED09B4